MDEVDEGGTEVGVGVLLGERYCGIGVLSAM